MGKTFVNQQLYGISPGIVTEFPPPIIAQIAPTGSNTNAPIGQILVQENVAAYMLIGFDSSGNAIWDELGVASGGPLDTINSLSPSGGNINIVGTVAQIGVANAGSTVTLSLIGPFTPATFTAHGVLIGEGSGPIVAVAPSATVGQALVSTGATSDPAYGTVVVAGGGTGAATLTGVLTGNGTSAITGNVVTQFGVLVGGASNAVASTAVGATGTVLIGNTGAAPTYSGSPSVSGSLTAATTITATLGAITATNGNVVFGTAGNKIISTSVATTTTAGANSFGTVTLVGGTATVNTSAVTANSIIMLTRMSVGATGAAALGILSVGTIVGATSFVINAWTTANATALATTDVSSVGWMLIN
jgi:hypothetical protein